MKMPLFDRFSRKHTGASDAAPAAAGPAVVQIDATALSRVFSAPMWLRDLGLLAWFLVGVGLVLFGLVWLLGLTSTIVGPVLVGAILATVAGPLVTKMQRHRIPRAAGAGIVLLGLLALGVVIGLLVFGGLYEQSSSQAAASEATDTVQSWLDDVGIQNTDQATEDAKSGTSQAGATLLQGVAEGIRGLTSLVFFLTFATFSTFFLLKDGPTVRGFINRNMGVPAAVANTVTGNVVLSLRRYFLV